MKSHNGSNRRGAPREFWFTLVVGDAKIPAHVPDVYDSDLHAWLGELARRPDEEERAWDAAWPAPSRLGDVADSGPGDPLWGARCILDELCADCPPRREEGVDTRGNPYTLYTTERDGSTYLREGRLTSLCPVHVRPGDLRIAVEDVRTRMMSREEKAARLRTRIRELAVQGKSTREIASELGVSQSTVQYHLKLSE